VASIFSRFTAKMGRKYDDNNDGGKEYGNDVPEHEKTDDSSNVSRSKSYSLQSSPKREVPHLNKEIVEQVVLPFMSIYM
jgi:hypothetical protein